VLVQDGVVISVTLGALPDALLNLDTHGEFLRGYDRAAGQIEDEPRAGIETACRPSSAGFA
jgi:putative ATP-dependent endonuclease of the OLD family